jgi:two-component system response regulator DegU
MISERPGRAPAGRRTLDPPRAIPSARLSPPIGTSTGSLISVVVQDRSTFFREALACILAAEPGLHVATQVEGADQLLDATRTTTPDVVFLEVQSTPWEVAALLEDLARLSVPPRLVGVGRPAERRGLHRLDGRLLARTAPAEEFVRAAGVEPCVDAAHQTPLDFSQIAEQGFTERELRILSLLGAGWTTVQISERLKLSPRSIRGIRERVLAKLGAQSSAQAVAEAIRRGLLGPGSDG